MDGAVLAAIVTVLGALVIAATGFVVNRRLGLPGQVQRTIREERKLYEGALEAKVRRLEDELAEEKAGRETDRDECLEKINRLADALVDAGLVNDRLQARVVILEEKA